MICIECIHKSICYRYRLDIGAREGTCTDYIPMTEMNDLKERAYGHIVGQGTKGVIRE